MMQPKMTAQTQSSGSSTFDSPSSRSLSPENRPLQQSQPGPLKRPQTVVKPLQLQKTTVEQENGPDRSRPLQPIQTVKQNGTVETGGQLSPSGLLGEMGRSLPSLITEPSPVLEETRKGTEEVLAAGTRFEQQRQWSEAVAHYQNALKTFHNDPTIRERYQIARFHYYVTRRCSDQTYEQLLRQSSLGEVLWMFENTLTVIRDNYIDVQQWGVLFQSGLQNWEIALSEPVFLKKNGITASTSTINETCRKIRELSQPWSFFDMKDMKNGVLNVADLAQREIGLSINASVLEFLVGAANSLDPHSCYLTLRELNDWYSMIDGRLIGIGFELDSDSYSMFITRVLPKSPAEQAGLAEGDRILAVDGKSTVGLSYDESADLLQGRENSRVVLRIGTDGRAERDVSIVRREIEVTSVEQVCKLNEELGYIRLNCFQNNTVEDLQKAYRELQKEGMRGLVLDLRHNPGGSLPAAVGVANLFLEAGVIVRTQRPRQIEMVYTATTPGTWNIPLIVLIDEESASAAEIFAGAIRDHKRGILIGKRSFGKGTVQQFFNQDLPSRSLTVAGLKMTIERFYSPNGRSFSDIGVLPDIVLNDEVHEDAVRVSKPDISAVQEDKFNRNEQRGINGQSGQSGSGESFVKIAPHKQKRIRSTLDDPYISAAITASRLQLDQQRLTQLRP